MLKDEKELRDSAYAVSTSGRNLAKKLAAAIMRLKKQLRK
jgi:hypothetical protein